MKKHTFPAAILVLSAALVAATNTRAQRNTNPVIVFVSDGMRHDFMKRFAAEGKMSAYGRLLKLGIDAGPGMIPPVPPNSGVAWTTLGTGAPPSVSAILKRNSSKNMNL